MNDNPAPATAPTPSVTDILGTDEIAVTGTVDTDWMDSFRRSGDRPASAEPRAEPPATGTTRAAGAPVPRDEEDGSRHAPDPQAPVVTPAAPSPATTDLPAPETSAPDPGSAESASAPVPRREPPVATARPRRDRRDRAELPSSPLRVRCTSDSSSSVPRVSGMPEPVVSALRTRVETAATAAGYDPRAAHDFAANRLSTSQLVVALLVAALDIPVAPEGPGDHQGLGLDEATWCAVRLLGSQDPLMVSVLDRLQALEHLAGRQMAAQRTIDSRLGELAASADVIEAVTSWLVAERAEDLTKGIYQASDINVETDSAASARRVFRDQVEARRGRETRAAGRPIR